MADRIALHALDHLAVRDYFTLYFLFEVKSDQQPRKLTSVLKRSLGQTVRAIPLLAGHVVPVQDGEDRLGRLEIGQGRRRAVDLVLRDHSSMATELDMTFDSLRRDHFPLARLHATILSPVDRPLERDEEAPVFQTQANVIPGGLILTMCFHHSAMDITAASCVVQTWARFCRSSYFASERVPVSVLSKETYDRARLLTPSPPIPSQTPAGFSLEKDRGAGGKLLASATTKQAILHFNYSNLVELKTLATPKESSDWISTNDALSALLWSAITRARVGNIADASSSSSLGLAVDCRGKLGRPLTGEYIGNAVLPAIAHGALTELTDLPENLGSLASKIRKAIRSVDQEYIQTTSAWADSLDDTRDATPNLNHHFGQDILLSSWAKQPLLGFDWGPGLGQKPCCMRSPLGGLDGVCVVLPALPGGGLEVTVCLQSGHMERLLSDSAFLRFADVRSV